MKPISKLILFFTSVLLIVSSSCNKEGDHIPYVPVNFTIDLNDPEYSALNAVGNSIIVYGGYNGIVIYRKSMDEFVALERTCTYQPSQKCDMKIDDSGLYITCECCESSFLLLDGSPIDEEKPAILSLKSYTALYTQGNNTLKVFN